MQPLCIVAPGSPTTTTSRDSERSAQSGLEHAARRKDLRHRRDIRHRARRIIFICLLTLELSESLLRRGPSNLHIFRRLSSGPFRLESRGRQKRPSGFGRNAQARTAWIVLRAKSDAAKKRKL